MLCIYDETAPLYIMLLKTSFYSPFSEANPVSPSVCSAGCIAGIVIACLVFLGAAVGGIVYYIHKKK